ncbi:AprI/Inh family metalloprotease inhibitor [Stenotrophomonas sp.]|uniref:AprI/Inh family metalloprotease inhibitor n=1 Tax=Stenotrophomonas sp. TaxID=69392 RepID=UPI002D35C7E5|nr:AprI/Inh family metalloprotease inhibitor [Stenotrophomonas sp.]HYQ21942.1 AprI/Inh family metalloprotease inhibitor [Stenotrophomonas sp.]
MAIRFPHAGLLALCSLALSATAGAQDASFGAGQSTTTQSSNRSQTSETTRSTTGSGQDDSDFANMGAVTTETTTTGSAHSESRSHSSDAEVDIRYHDDSDDDWHSGRHHERGSVRDSDLPGDWTLGQENGSSCTITLKDSQWFGGYGAWVPAGCPDGFFAVNRWLLSGNELLLTDTNNQVIGRFRQGGGGRWSGRRESDGSRIYLNPR